MHEQAQKLFYFLFMFVLASVIFVLLPTSNPKFSLWQEDVRHKFAVATIQTIGDQPFFADAELVFDSIDNFYTHATDAAIALLEQPEIDQDIIYVYGEVYHQFAKVLHLEKPTATNTVAANFPEPKIGPDFMTQEPLYNIVPYRTVVKTIGIVAGAAINVSQMTNPVNSSNQPWVTMRDALTGQYYCLAVFNGEVNKYLGSCKFDYN